jgi:hypothetical protein
MDSVSPHPKKVKKRGSCFWLMFNVWKKVFQNYFLFDNDSSEGTGNEFTYRRFWRNDINIILERVFLKGTISHHKLITVIATISGNTSNDYLHEYTIQILWYIFRHRRKPLALFKTLLYMNVSAHKSEKRRNAVEHERMMSIWREGR